VCGIYASLDRRGRLREQRQQAYQVLPHAIRDLQPREAAAETGLYSGGKYGYRKNTGGCSGMECPPLFVLVITSVMQGQKCK